MFRLFLFFPEKLRRSAVQWCSFAVCVSHLEGSWVGLSHRRRVELKKKDTNDQEPTPLGGHRFSLFTKPFRCSMM